MTEQKELAAKDYKFEAAVANANAEEMIISNKISDPVFLAQLVYSLKEERERTNSLIATVISKIEKLEMQVESLEKELEKSKKKERCLLGEVDSELLSYVKKKGIVTAEEVQKHFNYKGTNGASSRLHRLFSLGYLDKKQAGRKVYYMIK